MWAEAEPAEGITIVSKTLGEEAFLPHKLPKRLEPIAEALKTALQSLDERRGVRLLIESELPLASGLGSSSAAAVASLMATTSALGHSLSLDEVLKLAMISEKMVHKSPSGIDVHASTYGDIFLFKKGGEAKVIKLEEPVNFCIGFTGIKRATSDMVARFSKLEEERPCQFKALVKSSSCLSKIAAEAIEEGDLEKLGSILNFYQAVLAWFRVSSPELDAMIEDALKAGALGAKLTGAGGGGCILALPRRGEAKRLVEVLRQRGADAFDTTVPQKGVKVWRV